MATTWMRPKLAKMVRDGLAAPTKYSTSTISKAEMRAMVQSLDHAKITRIAGGVIATPEGRSNVRPFYAANEPRFDKRTYGDFNRRRNTNFQRGMLGDAMVLGGPARLLPRGE
jgi:hypothetical protein